MPTNQGMQRSGGGEVSREIDVYSRRPLIPVDYEVQGLQVTVATVFFIFRGYIVLWSG